MKITHKNIHTYIHTYHTFWPRAKVWVEQGITFWCGNFPIEINKFIPSTTLMFAPDHGFLKIFFFQTHLVNITIIAWLLIVIFQTLMIFVLYDILILHTSYPKQITKIWLSHLVKKQCLTKDIQNQLFPKKWLGQHISTVCISLAQIQMKIMKFFRIKDFFEPKRASKFEFIHP